MSNKSRVMRIFLFVAALLGWGLATAQEVSTNYDRTVDFSKYKTYKWVQITGAQHPDQLTDKNIVSVIDAQLAGKALTKKDADPVDLYVGYGASVDKEKEITGFGGGPGWRMGGMASATTSTISNGTILLDIYDPAAKSLVWRGTATESLDPSSSPDKKQKRLEKAMKKLLMGYPPPAPQK